MPTRERHQLNFNLIWPLRKYTKEVVLGWLANGGMDDAPVGGLVTAIHSGMLWGSRRTGTQKQLMKSREGALGYKDHHMIAVPVMGGRRPEPHSLVPEE